MQKLEEEKIIHIKKLIINDFYSTVLSYLNRSVHYYMFIIFIPVFGISQTNDNLLSSAQKMISTLLAEGVWYGIMHCRLNVISQTHL